MTELESNTITAERERHRLAVGKQQERAEEAETLLGIERRAAEAATDELRAEIERQRQVITRLSAPGIERAPWFYAPCPECGAIEGMGLVTPRTNGKLMPGHTCTWCANCEHYGPPVPTNAADVRASDRAATMAWNREFAQSFSQIAEAARLREENANYDRNAQIRATEHAREVERLKADIVSLRADRENYRAKLLELLDGKSDWQPFETAPMDGTEVLVYGPDTGVFLAVYQHSIADDGEDGHKCWFALTGEDLTNGHLLTHWRPLPEGPGEQQFLEAEVQRLTGLLAVQERACAVHAANVGRLQGEIFAIRDEMESLKLRAEAAEYACQLAGIEPHDTGDR